MQFSGLVRARRMSRRYRSDVHIDRHALTEFLDLATRSPSAGFSQGWDFVILDETVTRERFWHAAGADDAGAGPVDPWLAGMRQASVLVLCLSDPQRYLDRYAEPDKGWADRDLKHWPVPYWDIDTGMASLLLHLAAIDSGLGSCFFGVPAERHHAVREVFAIPPDRRIVGVVSIGVAEPGPRSPSLKRGRRRLAEVVHDGRFGVPWPIAAPTATSSTAAPIDPARRDE